MSEKPALHAVQMPPVTPAVQVAQSLAQGYIPTALLRPDLTLEIEILGERRPARLQDEPPFDPQGARMRM